MEYDSFIVKWMWGGNFPFFTLPVSHSFICLAGPRAFVPWIQEVNDSTIFYLQPNLVPYYYCCHCSSSSPSGVRMLLSLLRIPWDFIAWRECSRLKFYLWGVNFKQQYLHPEGSSDPTVVAFHLFNILRIVQFCQVLQNYSSSLKVQYIFVKFCKCKTTKVLWKSSSFLSSFANVKPSKKERFILTLLLLSNLPTNPVRGSSSATTTKNHPQLKY